MANSIHNTGLPRTEAIQPSDAPAQVPTRNEPRQNPEHLLCQFKQQAALFNQLEQQGQLKNDKQGQALRTQVNEACSMLEELLAGPLAEESSK